MTDRDHFIAALDADPSDQVMRAVFADWLEEHGDGDADRRLAAGLRWMAEKNAIPCKSSLFDFWYTVVLTDAYRKKIIADTCHECEVALAESLWAAGITAVLH